MISVLNPLINSLENRDVEQSLKKTEKWKVVLKYVYYTYTEKDTRYIDLLLFQNFIHDWRKTSLPQVLVSKWMHVIKSNLPKYYSPRHYLLHYVSKIIIYMISPLCQNLSRVHLFIYFYFLNFMVHSFTQKNFFNITLDFLFVCWDIFKHLGLLHYIVHIVLSRLINIS